MCESDVLAPTTGNPKREKEETAAVLNAAPILPVVSKGNEAGLRGSV